MMTDKLRLLSLIFIFLLVLSISFTASPITPRSDYDHIVLFNEGSCSLTYSAKGNLGDNYDMTFKMEGLSVYADLQLSHLLDANVSPPNNIYDTYWIYAQKLSAHFGGNITGESIYDSSDIYREDTLKESWSFSRSFALPLPDRPSKMFQ